MIHEDGGMEKVAYTLRETMKISEVPGRCYPEKSVYHYMKVVMPTVL